MKCVACGSASLVEGEVVDMKGGKMGAFKLSGVSKWKSMFGVGIRGVRAYGCVNCQHLQFAVDFSEEDVRRYRRFEGEPQLSVLERVNAERDGPQAEPGQPAAEAAPDNGTHPPADST